MFVRVIKAHNGVIYIIFSTKPYKSIGNLLHSFFLLTSQYILDNMSLKDNNLIILKLHPSSSYHKNFRGYKLLNMTTPKKMVCNIRNFSSKNEAHTSIC